MLPNSAWHQISSFWWHVLSPQALDPPPFLDSLSCVSCEPRGTQNRDWQAEQRGNYLQLCRPYGLRQRPCR